MHGPIRIRFIWKFHNRIPNHKASYAEKKQSLQQSLYEIHTCRTRLASEHADMNNIFCRPGYGLYTYVGQARERWEIFSLKR